MPALTKGPSTVGMMEGAFFVGQRELLSWANDVLQLNLTKVEQCANGAVYCSVIDACHPGKVNMRKLNWTARNDAPETIANYKVLQQAFDKCGIDRHVEVDKLIRGKCQDNLEMLQWIKCYFENTYAGDGLYDADRARSGMQLPDWARSTGVAAKENVPPRNPVPGRNQGNRRSFVTEASKPVPQSAARLSRNSAAPGPAASPPLRGGGVQPTDRLGGPPQSAVEQLREENGLQKDEIADLKSSVDGLESERDYYFGKLRDIEILCQTLEDKGPEGMTVKRLIQDVQTILYQKDEEDEPGGAAGNPTPDPPGPPSHA